MENSWPVINPDQIEFCWAGTQRHNYKLFVCGYMHEEPSDDSSGSQITSKIWRKGERRWIAVLF